VVLAVYREISIERWLVTLTLVLFGLTALVCMMAMTLAAGYFADTPNPPTKRSLMWLLIIISFTFMLAVVLFTFLPSELPQWAALLISIYLCGREANPRPSTRSMPAADWGKAKAGVPS